MLHVAQGAVRSLRSNICAGITTLCMMLLSVPVSAQEGGVASIVVIKPKEGMQKKFEEGYKRHLEWHRQNNDPWVWFGWQFITGERLFWFMDGTFGHTWDDFDKAVNPAGDAADNAANVVPYGDFVSRAFYTKLAEVSTSNVLEEGKASAVIELRYYKVVPGKERDFEQLLQKAHRASAMGREQTGYTWYKLVSGGEQPAYLLMIPLPKFSELRQVEQSPLDMFVRSQPTNERMALERALSDIVRETQSEAIRHRADLSYVPGQN